jgi:hypothetical protein
MIQNIGWMNEHQPVFLCENGAGRDAWLNVLTG